MFNGSIPGIPHKGVFFSYKSGAFCISGSMPGNAVKRPHFP